MGMFSFVKNAGASIFKSDEKQAESIRKYVLETLEKQAKGNRVENLAVECDEGMVTLSGMCNSVKTREKVILIAGNVEDVEQVNADGLSVVKTEAQTEVQAGAAPEMQAEARPTAAPQPEPEARSVTAGVEKPAVQAPEQESQFYTIQSGDTLSAIAKKFYGDANKYMFIVEENTGVIENPDRIYPGQTIRIPPLQ